MKQEEIEPTEIPQAYLSEALEHYQEVYDKCIALESYNEIFKIISEANMEYGFCYYICKMYDFLDYEDVQYLLIMNHVKLKFDGFIYYTADTLYRFHDTNPINGLLPRIELLKSLITED